MRKFYIIGLFLLCSISLMSQTMETGTITSDSIATKPHKKNFFVSVIDFIVGDYDTLYVTPNKYDLAFMTTYYYNNEFYSVKSSNPKDQMLHFSPRPSNKIGLYFGWQFIFLGWSFDINDWFKGSKHTKNSTSFELNLYSARFGVDITYMKTGNDYKIHKARGFDDALPADYSVKFDGLNVEIKGLNLYYLFNNRKFSYPSVYSQSSVQRISCGSGIIGLSVSTHDLHFDYNKLPLVISENMNDDMKVHHIKYTNISLSGGYSYNWVIAKNVLFNISASPVIAYKVSKTSSLETSKKGLANKFNVDLLLRSGIVYNNGKYYVGASFLGRNYGYKQKNFSLNGGYGALQVYAGFNFLEKKEYRKAKKK